jgi:hypothetical protein
MPTLNEYLGSIISSITNARVQSDIQSVNVAEQYAKHSLLQHFAVPRMRIENVELTIPVALDTFEETGERIYKLKDLEAFNTLVYKEMSAIIGPRIPDDLAKLLRDEITDKTTLLISDISIIKNLDPLRGYIQSLLNSLSKRSDKFTVLLTDAQKKKDIEKLQLDATSRLENEFNVISEHKTITGLNIIAESDKIREKKPESLVYIKMRISEEGMEWHKMENNKGEIEKRLLPE